MATNSTIYSVRQGTVKIIANYKLLNTKDRSRFMVPGSQFKVGGIIPFLTLNPELFNRELYDLCLAVAG